ncbi:MAG: type VI secretion system ATPase TssH [Pseudomonadaceae bacterium]|nr:MAG: type VI secretion system ATPase TssH [Pseudomonadaceae bacterium]
MTRIDLPKLIQTLSADCRQLLEAAAQRCVQRRGHQVLVEDVLACLLDEPDSLLQRALRDAEIEPGELAKALQPQGGQGESNNPVLATELVQWLQDALLLANLELARQHIDQAALLLSLLQAPERYLGGRSPHLLNQINQQRLRDFSLASNDKQTASASTDTDNDALQRYTHHLTQQARTGQLDPVLCRDDEIRQMIDILARRRKNNPIVVGEAGVGKTAIIEGLALRIAAGEVPDALQQVEIHSLDLGLLQAGASIKGEFERRLQGVIQAVQNAERPIVLFIDEAHTLIGAGAQAGGSDAANLLKPALARGELRTIAATTWSEYKKYFEKDPALTRRFQPVQLHEPTIEQAITILRGLAPVYEQSHGIYLRDDAVVAAAELSARYLAGRQLPDKAVDLLDTACARVRISLAAAPEPVEALRTRIAEGERRRQAQLRDQEAGLPIDSTDLQALNASLDADHAALQQVQIDWQAQRELASELLDVRQQLGRLHTGAGAELPEQATSEQLTERLHALQSALVDQQQQQRLVSYEVCPRLVAEVLSQWTSIPHSQLAREHNQKILSFANDLRERVRGQEGALQVLDQSMRAQAAGLNRSDRPAGVFLLVGPSGVGKTETALAIADLLYGGERFLTTINMSEFQEKHSVARLLGAPPGYVGYGEGGMLTEAVRQKPYSVVLLDEVEKADPDVLNIFYQIFDKGIANDGEGRAINFRNCLFLLTSNLASEQLVQACQQHPQATSDQLQALIQPRLQQHFKPALLARMQVLPYRPIAGELLGELITLKLQQFAQRLQLRGLAFSHEPELTAYLAERCHSQASGARLIDQLIEQRLQPLIANRLLDAMALGESLSSVHATVTDEGHIDCEFA